MIDNANIGSDGVSNDGLHLNKKGIYRFTGNFINYFTTRGGRDRDIWSQNDSFQKVKCDKVISNETESKIVIVINVLQTRFPFWE